MDKLGFIYEGEYIPHFDYKEIGIQGVGKHHYPIINMDKYVDHTNDNKIHLEICKGLALSQSHFKIGMYGGDMPPEEEQRLGSVSWTRILKEIEKYDPTGEHRENINNIIHVEKDVKSVYKYIYFALGGIMPWFFNLYIKENHFITKTKGGKYTEAAKHFPLLIEYAENLPFKSVGRILIFTTFPNTGVAAHRDSMFLNHKDHAINLFFNSGDRPSYMWDEVNKEKLYLEKGARSYFFNNRDYHGVDPEPVFRYTVRVDGVFEDWLCDELGLENGYVGHTDYTKD